MSDILDEYESHGRLLVDTNGAYHELAPRCPHCGGQLYLETMERPFPAAWVYEWRCGSCVKWAFVEPPNWWQPNEWTALVVMGLGAS